jgi:hypothetical protein
MIARRRDGKSPRLVTSKEPGQHMKAQGLQALDCLKEHVKPLPPACRKAVQALSAARCEGF